MIKEHLTIVELTNIIFQRPDRLTKDVLANPSLGQRLKDRFLVIHDDILLPKIGFTRIIDGIFLTFRRAKGEVVEHPRSLLNAAKELRAIGYSNAQIREIREKTYRFTLGCLEHTRLAEQIEKEFPKFVYDFDDRGFLGILYVGKGLSASVEWLSRPENHLYTERTEPMAYNMFVESLAYHHNLPRLLKPANPKLTMG